MAPIDIVQAQAEVASNEERVIVADANIKAAQDNLRALILDPATPDFWTVTFEPTDAAGVRRAGHRRRRRGPERARQAVGSARRRRTASSRATSTSGTSGTRSCRTSTPTCTYVTTAAGGVAAEPGRFRGHRRAAAADRAIDRLAARLRHRARRRVSEPYPELDGRRARSAIRSARARLAGEPGARAAAVPAGADAAQEPAAAGRDAGAQRRAQRADQPAARAIGARVARAAGEEARGRGEEAGRRHVARASSSSRRSATSRSHAPPRSRRSPTTTSRSSISRPSSWCRSAASAAASRPPARARCRSGGIIETVAARQAGRARPAGQAGRSPPAYRCPSCLRPQPFLPFLPFLPCPPASGTLPPVPKLSVTVITKNEAADIGAALASVAWADEIVVVDSHSTDDTVGDRATAHRPRRRPRLARLRRAEELRGVAGEPRLDSVARRRRARDAGAGGARSRRCWRPTPPQAAFRIPRVTWHLGRWVRTTDWYPDYQLRLYDRRAARVDRPVRARVGDGPRRDRAAARRAAALRLPRHRRSSRDDRSLHDVRRAPDARGRPPRRRCCSSPATRRSRFCATTSRAAAFATASPGFIISALNAYYVFLKFAKLWELQRPNRQTLRTIAKLEPEPERLNHLNDVLPAHRHGAHLARRPEPGAADRQRPARRSASARRSSRIPTASCGGARPKGSI